MVASYKQSLLQLRPPASAGAVAVALGGRGLTHHEGGGRVGPLGEGLLGVAAVDGAQAAAGRRPGGLLELKALLALRGKRRRVGGFIQHDNRR